MRYVTLAVDFDGTLAHDGHVTSDTAAALGRLRESGRNLVLVTGRQLRDLRPICPQLPLFNLVVAENGGVLHWPANRDERQLTDSPPRALIDALRHRGVEDVSVGCVVVDIKRPHEGVALEVIRELGLAHQVIFNKGAVMILPPSIDKGSGLRAAIDVLGVSRHNVVAIGDAENDHAMFELAGCSVAVANALPMVKQHADLVTKGAYGAGVTEIIDGVISNDLADLTSQLPKRSISIGVRHDGSPLVINPCGDTVLIAGPSGSGKSTALLGILEQLSLSDLQYCVVDPEGDYLDTPYGIPIGDWEEPPSTNDVMQLLKRPGHDPIACLLGVPLADRPSYFAALHALLLEHRARTGRPHWLAIDEAHHLLPAWSSVTHSLPPNAFAGTLLATVDPAHLSSNALTQVSLFIATGEQPRRTMESFCAAIDNPPPLIPDVRPSGGLLIWRRSPGEPPTFARLTAPKHEIRRHRRKYAHGAIDPAHSFVFTGPTGAHHALAANLTAFVDIASKVDDETWLFHLLRGDFTRWFTETIKDDELAIEAERARSLAAEGIVESRSILRRAVEQRYTLET